MGGRSDYEERRKRRIESYKRKSVKARKEAEKRENSTANRILAMTAGQPILIGHHSERKAINLHRQAERDTRKSIELADKSQYYERKAKRVENSKVIYNDDPNAATPDPTEKLPSASAEWYNNKKHITFLDPPASYAQKKGYLDPWGKTYFIVYKSDGELQNKLDGLYMTGSNAYPKETLLTPVAVFTREGPYTTKDLDSARYATSWEGVKTY